MRRAADSDERVAEKVRSWLEGAVVGLDLCPFAGSVVRSERLAIVVRSIEDPDEAVRAVLSEAVELIEAPAMVRSTTLVVLPLGLDDFDDFLAVAEAVDDALEAGGAAALLQTATFHPDYRFAGVAADDIGNYTNRSPFPLIHLLRVGEVADAVASHPDPDGIPERNVARLRALGLDDVRRLWRSWARPTEESS